MKKLVIVFALALSTGAAFAQTQNAPAAQKPMAPTPARQMPSPEERAKRQTERMEKMLNLNKEQSAKINEVNLGFNKKMDDARKSGKPNNRESFTDAMKDRDAQYQKIMTSEQFGKYQQMSKPQPRPANAPSTVPAGTMSAPPSVAPAGATPSAPDQKK